MSVAGGANQHAAVRARRRPPPVPEVGHRVRGCKPKVMWHLSTGNSGGLGSVVLRTDRIVTAHRPVARSCWRARARTSASSRRPSCSSSRISASRRHECGRGADDLDVLQARHFPIDLAGQRHLDSAGEECARAAPTMPLARRDRAIVPDGDTRRPIAPTRAAEIRRLSAAAKSDSGGSGCAERTG